MTEGGGGEGWSVVGTLQLCERYAVLQHPSSAHTPNLTYPSSLQSDMPLTQFFPNHRDL